MSTAAFLAAIGAGLMGFIRVFRSPQVQSILPPQWRWEQWPALAQVGFVFGVSLTGAVATALSQGTPIGAALMAGLTAALAAMGLNSATKNIGHDLTINAVAKDLHYKPSVLRDALSIALPINRELLNNVAVSTGDRKDQVQ